MNERKETPKEPTKEKKTHDALLVVNAGERLVDGLSDEGAVEAPLVLEEEQPVLFKRPRGRSRVAVPPGPKIPAQTRANWSGIILSRLCGTEEIGV